jgi:transketolase
LDAALHRLCANTLKGLAMDAVQAAKSGHPGMPLGMADVATVLWTRFLVHDPSDAAWPDRDRFVLSAGHGSMLLYGLLHLSGYDLSVDDLKAFRQLHSRTPGHPEHGETHGVETTTGPLGQGFANAVGMAFAERFLRETFGADLCDHFVYAIAGDGDLMEGISYEAASLAGHWRLGRLVVLYDDNHISIEGSTDLAFTEDRLGRFAAAGWHVQQVDGHDPEAVAAAIEAARADARPSLVACRTEIGKDSPLEGSEACHGAPLGEANVRTTKQRIGVDPDAKFVVPDGAVAAFRAPRGAAARAAWAERVAAHPDRERFLSYLAADPEAAIGAAAWPTWASGSVATRKASQAALQAIVRVAPWVIGGSADLAGSNGTEVGTPSFTPERFGGAGTIHFGVREHAMAGIANGIVLHGGARPYCATFLVFHDYHRPSVRLSALMRQPVVYVYSHDSIFLGEDGPTHQPVVTLLALRSLPGMCVVRPADANETVAAWKLALRRVDGPTALVLTRQNLPILAGTSEEGVSRGGYVLEDADEPDVTLIGTGSEVSLVVDAARLLRAEGRRVRVVSMPSVDRFYAQDAAYRAGVLGAAPRLAVEAATTLGWERIVGDRGAVVGIDRFGASAPIEALAQEFGFTAENVAARARALL